MSAQSPVLNDASEIHCHDLGESEGRSRHQCHYTASPPRLAEQDDLRGRARGQRERRPRSQPGQAEAVPAAALVDDCERLGTLFGELNKCLRGIGFTQLYFGEKIVEPVVVLLFWVLLWFLGIQALGLVGTLCIVIIYIQK
ncbi:uncharacterized protein FAM241A [Chanos chanos]|uniref:Uncharacterized protein FAM241A n=1 Tax=Chanos chanos TaxID=29144 RepID=A0A6J2V711_CHACN|nr:uncharacterized protein FAM241A [Chanos chanos]